MQLLNDLPIARPPWSGLGRRLESLCRKALFEFHLVEGVEKVAIALSGGKDSLTLLYLLHAISGHGFPPFQLIAIHVDGEASCGAGVQFSLLQAVCRSLDVPLITRTSTQTLDGLECYSCSRERRSLIFEAARSEGATAVAFGHHRDDSAETLLMNLLHKGEFAANLPKLTMADYGVTIIRPLIYISESEIIAFAKQHGYARITCQCPVGQRSKRREVKQLLDQIEELFPNGRANIAGAGLIYGSRKAERFDSNSSSR